MRKIGFTIDTVAIKGYNKNVLLGKFEKHCNRFADGMIEKGVGYDVKKMDCGVTVGLHCSRKCNCGSFVAGGGELFCCKCGRIC
jgi:hypothetical protein